MPIYEYRCSNCENNFEELVRSSREVVVCPACASRKVERQLSVFSSPADQSGPAAAGGGGCGGCGPGGCACH